MDEMAQVGKRFICECGVCSGPDIESLLTDEEWSNTNALRDLLPGTNYIVNPGHVADHEIVEKHEKYWIVK